MYTDVHSANPGAPSRTRRTRMCGGRATPGCVSLVTFFAQALRRRSGANSGAGPEGAQGRMPGVKKVTRSPEGRVEALHLKQEDKSKSKNWIPACAGMTSKRAS